MQMNIDGADLTRRAIETVDQLMKLARNGMYECALEETKEVTLQFGEDPIPSENDECVTMVIVV